MHCYSIFINFIATIMTLPIDITTFCIASAAAVLLGISKSGVKGIGIFVVTLMAVAFDSKASTGIIMPLLILGDIFAVIYYKRHVVWSLLWKLLPAMAVGVLVGVLVGKQMDEALFRKSMSAIILVSVVIMYMWEAKKSVYVPKSRAFGIFMGLMAGFTTMIGNLAGVFSNIFFLAMRIDKNQFIGTAAYLFFIINLFKLPFHIFYWRTINVHTLTINLLLIPAIALGLYIGVNALKRINTAVFRKMILILTAVGALIMLLR